MLQWALEHIHLLERVFLFCSGKYTEGKLLKHMVILFLFIYFLLFRAAPMAYGSFQARGWIRATDAASLYHSRNAGSKPHMWPTPQLMATPDPWPTEKARDQTLILMNTGQIHFCCAKMGMLLFLIFEETPCCFP